MTQLSTSRLFHTEAIALVSAMLRRYRNGDIKDYADLTEELEDIVTQFESRASKPMLDYSPLVRGQPPHSAWMNEQWSAMQNDVNIMILQSDLLNSSSISAHNILKTEIERQKHLNAKLSNKLRTLQLYSSVPGKIVVGDLFADSDGVDMTMTPTGSTSVISGGVMTLGFTSQEVVTDNEISVEVLDSSNGFLGNLHELATANDETTPLRFRTFVEENVNSRDLNNIFDGNPNTWAEYEYPFVYPIDRVAAENYGFYYLDADSSSDDTPTLIDWAVGPEDGVLHFDLLFEFDEEKNINQIDLMLYGLRENRGSPVLVRKVDVSSDSITWTTITPQDVWIANRSDKSSFQAGADVFLNSARWFFPARSVKYARVYAEQDAPIDSDIAHLYYEQETVLEGESATPALGTSSQVNDPDWVLSEWPIVNDKDSSVTNTLDVTTKYAGTNSLKLVNDQNGYEEDKPQTINDSAQRVFTEIFEEGKEYRVTAWCYVEDFIRSAAYDRGLFVWDSANKVSYATSTLTTVHPILEWVKHEVVFRVGDVPRDIAQGMDYSNPYESEDAEIKEPVINVRLYSPKGTVYWDEVTIDELLPDGSAPITTVTTSRVEGPIPTLDDPLKNYSLSNSAARDGVTKDVEVFHGKRWAIGVRDFAFSNVEYVQKSLIVSNSYRFPGVVDQVALDANIVLPEGLQEENTWVKFYVSPDDGNYWAPISRVQDDYNEIPEVLSFNNPIPRDFRDSSISYYEIDGAVDSLRVKIELLRPTETPHVSPIVKDYQLIVVLR